MCSRGCGTIDQFFVDVEKLKGFRLGITALDYALTLC